MHRANRALLSAQNCIRRVVWASVETEVLVVASESITAGLVTMALLLLSLEAFCAVDDEFRAGAHFFVDAADVLAENADTDQLDAAKE